MCKFVKNKEHKLFISWLHSTLIKRFYSILLVSLFLNFKIIRLCLGNINAKNVK